MRRGRERSYVPSPPSATATSEPPRRPSAQRAAANGATTNTAATAPQSPTL